jgi:hypothetical protein
MDSGSVQKRQDLSSPIIYTLVYIQNPYFADFVTGMMGDISLLTGSNGEIRKKCRKD